MSITINYAAHQKQCGCSDPVGCIAITRENRRAKKIAKDIDAVLDAYAEKDKAKLSETLAPKTVSQIVTERKGDKQCTCSHPIPRVVLHGKISFECAVCGGNLKQFTATDQHNEEEMNAEMEYLDNYPEKANFCICVDPECIYMHAPDDPIEKVWRHDLPNKGRGYCRCEDPQCLLVHEVDDATEEVPPEQVEYIDVPSGLIKLDKGNEKLDELMEAGTSENSENLPIGCPKCLKPLTTDLRTSSLLPYDNKFYFDANSDSPGEFCIKEIDDPEKFLASLEDTRFWCTECMEENHLKIFKFTNSTTTPLVTSSEAQAIVPPATAVTTGLAKLPMDMLHICKSVDGKWKCACGYSCVGVDNATKHDGLGQKHMTEFRKGKWTCLKCAYETLSNKDAFEHDKIGRDKDKNTTTSYAHCVHAPKELMRAKKGEGTWSIWAGRRVDCESRLGEFDVVLNLTGWSIKKKHVIPIPELAKWETADGKAYREVMLDWPDSQAVNMAKEFWFELVDHIKKNNLKVLIFCVGGHGRTGTALACILVALAGFAPEQAITWVREKYCKETIESWSQIDYIYTVAGMIRDKSGKKDKKTSPSKDYSSSGGSKQGIIIYKDNGKSDPEKPDYAIGYSGV